MALGLAVLGLDHWYTAVGVLDTAAKSEICPLVGVWEPDLERLEWAGERHSGIIATTDVTELLSHSDIGIVGICAATDRAPELAKQALQAGKHVISVKPPARTLDELDAVIKVAEQSGKFYGSYECLQRFSPRAILLRELIFGGAIGMPMSFHQVGHGGLPKPWPDTESGADSWWLHKAQVPGGAWIDHSIYAIDLARYVFDAEVTQAMGIIQNRVHKELELEDYGMALVALSTNNGGNGVSVMMEDTWTAEAGGGRSRQEFIGSAGYIVQEGGDLVVRGKDGEQRHTIPAAGYSHMDAVADHLIRGVALPFGPADARANLAACLAVYESAQ